MTLPKVSFNMGRINPFERKKRVGPKKWYEDVQLSYSSLMENRIKTAIRQLDHVLPLPNPGQGQSAGTRCQLNQDWHL